MKRRRIRPEQHRRPVDRRPGICPGRRFALLAVLTLGVIGSSAGLAGADVSSNVLVTATLYTANGTSTDSVTVAALQANPGRCPLYQGRSMNELGRQGQVDVQLPENATWSLPSILGCLQTPIPLSAVTGITVIDSNGSPEEGTDSQLTPADLAPSGSDFNNSSEYPVIQALGSLNQYDRPSRGSPQGQPDDDFLDEVQGTQNDQPAPIAIEVFEGPRVTVIARASQTTVAAGGTVSFSATVSGANGSPLSYSWSFDGAAPSSTAAAPQATFNAVGQYDITVQVTDAAGGGGGAEIPITVGSEAPVASGSGNRTGAGGSRNSHSPTGPRTSSGNHAGGSAGTHKPPPTSSAKTGSASRGKAETNSPSQASTTPSSSSTAPNSASTTPAEPAASPPNPNANPNHATTSHSRPPRPPPRTSPLTRPPARVPGPAPLVTGQLISDVRPLPAGSSPLVHSVPAPEGSAPPAGEAVRTSAVPAVASALVIALLLGLGAARELRGRRGWHALRRGS
ncbi:MAG: PKD domain-containing protein [Solirubrobacterales bacterium]|nr:PKD domain-containing protein [Solirubrobacterales bacterium]